MSYRALIQLTANPKNTFLFDSCLFVTSMVTFRRPIFNLDPKSDRLAIWPLSEKFNSNIVLYNRPRQNPVSEILMLVL